MIDQLLTQFLEHLRYERNVSAHTLRNYESDLLQFFNYFAPADPNERKQNEPDIGQVDHLTIREWLATLHSDKKKKTSIARKLAALRTFFQFLVRESVVESNPAKLGSCPSIFPSKTQSASLKPRTPKPISASVTGPSWNCSMPQGYGFRNWFN